MNGLGFQIWQLGLMPEPEKLAQFCNHYRIKWLNIKLLNGLYKYNRLGGNNNKVIEYIKVLTSNGIKVGMWQFCYGQLPKSEGLAAVKAFNTFQKYGLSFLQIDAETGMWNLPGSKQRAKDYMDNLNLPVGIEVYLNSYRFPENFPQFPFSTFLSYNKITGNSPQVYWEFSHNPVDQLRESLRQYNKLPEHQGKIFIPIGSTYFRGVPEASGSWGPTIKDLENFTNECKDFPAFGFYSLDKIFKHYNNYGIDWMEAITGIGEFNGETPPPDDSPPDNNNGDEMRKVKCLVNYLNIRRGPSTSYQKVFYLLKGDTPDILEIKTNSNIWIRIGWKQWAAMRHNGVTYMEYI